MKTVAKKAVRENTGILDEASVAEFRTLLRGKLIRPGDAAYKETRQIYNAMIDKRPALIAQCVDVADVIAAVNFARERGVSYWPYAAADTADRAWAFATMGWSSI